MTKLLYIRKKYKNDVKTFVNKIKILTSLMIFSFDVMSSDFSYFKHKTLN